MSLAVVSLLFVLRHPCVVILVPQRSLPFRFVHPEGLDNSEIAFWSLPLILWRDLERCFPSKLRKRQLLHLWPGWTTSKPATFPLPGTCQRRESPLTAGTRSLQYLRKTEVCLCACLQQTEPPGFFCFPLSPYISEALGQGSLFSSVSVWDLLCCEDGGGGELYSDKQRALMHVTNVSFPSGSSSLLAEPSPNVACFSSDSLVNFGSSPQVVAAQQQ